MARAATAAKQAIARKVEEWKEIGNESEATFREPWVFPVEKEEALQYISNKKVQLKSAIHQLTQMEDELAKTKRRALHAYQHDPESLRELSELLEAHCETLKVEEYCTKTFRQLRNLNKRMQALEIQELSIKVTENVAVQNARYRYVDHDMSDMQGTPVKTEPADFSIIPVQTTPQFTGNPLGRRICGREVRLTDFYGKASEFGPFWQLFEQLVDIQPYSNIEKLSTLLSCCKGDASKTLSMIPRKGECYELAKQKLKDQYDDSSLLDTTLRQELQEYKKCKDISKELENSLNDIETIISRLESAGYMPNADTTTLIIGKFPDRIQDKITAKMEDAEVKWDAKETLKQLRTLVRREIRANAKAPYRTEATRARIYQFHTNKEHCPGCKGNHKFSYCRKFKDWKSRTNRVRELRLCFKCFSSKHSTRECNIPACECTYHHHKLLCKYNDSQTRSQSRDNSNEHKNRHGYRSRSFSNRSRRSYRDSRPGSRNRYDSRHRYDNRHSSRSSGRSEEPRSQSRSPSRNRDYSETQNSNSNQNRFRNEKREDKQYKNNSDSKGKQVKINRVNVESASSESSSGDEETSYKDFGNAVRVNKVQCDSRSTRLMTVNVQIRNRRTGKLENVLAVLDTAADESFIKEATALRLGLPHIKTTSITVATFGGSTRKTPAKVIEASLFNHLEQAMEVTLFTSTEVMSPYTTERLTSKDIKYLKRKGIAIDHIAEMSGEEVDPDILLGIDDHNFVTIKNSKRAYELPSGLCARETFFGFTVSGKPKYSQRITVNTAKVVRHNETEQISLEDTWKLEKIGITEDVDQNTENAKVVQHFYDTVEMKDGKISVQFPFKDNKNLLNDNYTLALSRLHQQFNLKNKNPDLWKQYCQVFEQQIASGILEDVPKHESRRRGPEEVPWFYLPHQAVVKMSSSTTRVRPVLDASSKKRGELSLNEVIFQGPLILPKLCGVLLRARKGNICVIGDVEKAFHMIKLQESQRNAARIVWLINPDMPPSLDNIRILRFTVLPFGINASPYLLGISIKYGLEQRPEQTLCKMIEKNLYVDNLVATCDDTESAVKIYQQSKAIFNDMAMNLREFMSNSQECNKQIQEKDFSKSANQKLLGIAWDPISDNLSFTLKMNFLEQPTKRKVLKSCQSTYDPLGLLIPLLLPARVFQQELWIDQYGWDQPLNELHCKKWSELCEAYNNFEICFPRKVMLANKHKARHELHTFVDASSRAYAACTYIRTIQANGNIDCNLVTARYRLTPVKELQALTEVSMPKLELLALQTGCLLTEFILTELDEKVDSIYIYSDSQIALSWLFSEKQLGTFVTNHIGKIKQLIDKWELQAMPCQVNYINTLDNPADCVTRGLSVAEFQNHIWLTGPAFLKTHAEKWPIDKTIEFKLKNKLNSELEPAMTETEPSGISDNKVRVNMTRTSAPIEAPPLTITLSDKSKDFKKNKRLIALVVKFVKKLVMARCQETTQRRFDQSVRGWHTVRTTHCDLDANETQQAENIIIRNMQKSITDELKNKCGNLQLYTDNNGIIRCKGRLGRAVLPLDSKDPILLVPNHDVTTVIITEIHKASGHQGANGTLANLRTRFWLPTGRRIITKIVRKCVNCQFWNNRPFRQPPSGDLPPERCTPGTRRQHGKALVVTVCVHGNQMCTFRSCAKFVR